MENTPRVKGTPGGTVQGKKPRFTAPAAMTVSLILLGCGNHDTIQSAEKLPYAANNGGSASGEIEKIGLLKKNFEDRRSEIRNKYGINVKIGEPSDTLYALNEITRGDDAKRHSEPMMNVISDFNAEKWARLCDVMGAIEKALSVYSVSFLSVVKTIYIADDIDNAGGFAHAAPHAFSIASGNRSIVIPSASRYPMTVIEQTVHHEITHILHGARLENWPFESPSLEGGWQRTEAFPKGFARNYGTKNFHEDIAVMGEAIMSSFVKGGRECNIPERIKSDGVLAKKVMFMTGSYFDGREGIFTRDFTLEEFRVYFKLPDLQELPFYSRMRTEDSFNYKFWNRQFAMAIDKDNR